MISQDSDGWGLSSCSDMTRVCAFPTPARCIADRPQSFITGARSQRATPQVLTEARQLRCPRIILPTHSFSVRPPGLITEPEVPLDNRTHHHDLTPTHTSRSYNSTPTTSSYSSVYVQERLSQGSTTSRRGRTRKGPALPSWLHVCLSTSGGITGGHQARGRALRKLMLMLASLM